MLQPFLDEENQSSSTAANDATSRTWIEWYNHRTWGEWFKATVLDYRESGINGIAFFAVMNAAYNTYNYSKDDQSLLSICTPALWALALAPQVYNRFRPLKSVDTINEWTGQIASIAAFSMIFSPNPMDNYAAAFFIPHVAPKLLSDAIGQYIPLETMKSLEGLCLVAAGICIFMGAPAMSTDWWSSKTLDNFLPTNLGVCVGVFGASRFFAPFYEKSEEVVQDEQGFTNAV